MHIERRDKEADTHGDLTPRVGGNTCKIIMQEREIPLGHLSQAVAFTQQFVAPTHIVFDGFFGSSFLTDVPRRFARLSLSL